MILLGVDTGGTFTDFVAVENDSVITHKVLSTPNAPEQAVQQGIKALGLEGKTLALIHGSTVATNAVLEKKGVKTAFITNTGFKDLLTIGRQARQSLYDLQPEQNQVPVPAELCLEVDCRLDSQGQWIAPLTDHQVSRLVAQLQSISSAKTDQLEAVAVTFLFAYLDDSAEQKIRASMPEGLFVSLSSEVLAEIGEYERAMATWLNAWVGPLIEGYINRLSGLLGDSTLAVMQSSGETMDATQAASQAVRMLLSGPAGGLVGAQYLAGLSGYERLLTFDMGGTSTDVALIDRKIQLSSRSHIGDYPVAVPMVDMHTIGAGGGSLAYLDEGGMLQVGPESAGADPGPACYGKGGSQATVTDANLLLGRLPENAMLGGYLTLDRSAALEGVSRLAEAMHISVDEAAKGIIEVANEHMARALRVISVQQGYDPTEFVLVSFGGSGGLHVCALAERLQINKAMVPVYSGVLSAVGMVTTRPGRQLSKTHIQKLKIMSDDSVSDQLLKLSESGVEALVAEGVALEHIERQFSLDLRYRGQSSVINVDWQNIHACEEAFHRQHQHRFGHRMQAPVELVNLRAAVIGPAREINLKSRQANDEVSGPVVSPDNLSNNVPVYQRQQLKAGQSFPGPAIIVEKVATTWVEGGWWCDVDEVGNLLLQTKKNR